MGILREQPGHTVAIPDRADRESAGGHMHRTLLIAALGVLLSGGVHAQNTIYRCIDAEGGTLYTQTPCAQGTEVVDLGPNAELAEGAHEAALRRENARLREEIQRLERHQNTLDTTRTTEDDPADERSMQAHSFACDRATRAYANATETVRPYGLEKKRVAMHQACGTHEPPSPTHITSIRSGYFIPLSSWHFRPGLTVPCHRLQNRFSCRYKPGTKTFHEPTHQPRPFARAHRGDTHPYYAPAAQFHRGPVLDHHRRNGVTRHRKH